MGGGAVAVVSRGVSKARRVETSAGNEAVLYVTSAALRCRQGQGQHVEAGECGREDVHSHDEINATRI